MQTVSLRLETLVDAWRADGCPEQEAFSWKLSKPNWLKLAVDFNVDIDSFPEYIDRQFLWRLSESRPPVEALFLAVMIWGYGNIGYGPHRVRKMFESDDFLQSLKLVKGLCDEGKTLEAYSALKMSRIRQLGPSFGSKVLTFFHSRESAPAILDSIVATWLNKNAPNINEAIQFQAETWNLNTYSKYVNWIEDMSHAYGVHGCTLEQMIFSDEYGLS